MTRRTYTTPTALEFCIQAATGKVPLGSLARSVGELSAFFTTHRAVRPRNYFEVPAHRAAYLRYFLVANYCKLHAVLDEMKPPLQQQLEEECGGITRKGRPFRVLDFGAGPGTMTLSAMDYLHTLSPHSVLSFTAIDSNRQILKDCEQLFLAYQAELGLSPEQASLETIFTAFQDAIEHMSDESFDLIIMANAWNEMVEETQSALPSQVTLMKKLLGRLHPSGALILIEPALRKTSRQLLLIHDAVLQELPAVNIFAPCVHQQKCPCLAAGNEKDWCHAEYDWKPTPEVAAIDQRIGNRKDALKFSYLVFRKDGKNALRLRTISGPRGELSTCWRVVSEVIREKGKQRAFLCGELGRIQFVRLDRLEAATNREFGELARGDLVLLENAEQRQNDWRIMESTRVVKI